MQKKHFVCFVLKSIIWYIFFLIAMDDWWFVIMCCLIEDHSTKDHCAKHSRYCHDYHRSLDKFHRQLQQRKIPRCSLLEQSQSAWCCLYKSRIDQGMITLTGFGRACHRPLGVPGEERRRTTNKCSVVCKWKIMSLKDYKVYRMCANM
jgi:hypothetical protein